MISTSNGNNNLDFSDTSSTDYRKLFNNYLSYWPWFVASVAICLCLAFIYVRNTIPVYRVSARLLVNDDKKGSGLSGGSSDLADLSGILGSKNSVDNEVEVLKTKALMKKVVQDLQLNTTYFVNGRFQKIELYEAPFLVKSISLLDKVSTTDVDLVFLKGDRISYNLDGVDRIVKFNQRISIPNVGVVTIVKNVHNKFLEDRYSFRIQSVRNRASQVSEALNVSVANKLITIIDLSLNTQIPKEGEDILNRLIFNYVQQNLDDKNEIADSTISFINRRLMIIGSELGQAESNIQGFKQTNNLADMSEQGKLLVSTSSQNFSDLAKVETQISVIRSVLEYLSDESNDKRILPTTLMPDDRVFSSALESYNLLLQERARKLIGLAESNPIILNLDSQIQNSRNGILSNLRSTLSAFVITKNRLKSQMKGTESQIKQVPETERNYLRLARQQQIKQELYIFLMQKSEETAISKTANIANSRTIDPPESDIFPLAPKPLNIYVISFFFGLIAPISILFIRDWLNVKVETKEDISKATAVTIVGEISHNSVLEHTIVSSQSRSPIAEQFRSLRTNLSFYLNTKDEKVILLTSSMGGEGKSFISINLATVLALSGKKVLLMELDLRKPGLSTKLNVRNSVGFTNYVISSDVSASDIIKPLDIHDNLFLISSGPIPPNPAENLISVRAVELFKELRDQFDYIIVDAPPIGIVTDAQLLAEYADLCLYVVRQNFTLKTQLHIVEDLYVANRMKKMGIVVNDINTTSNYGYGYGYGYGDYGQSAKKN
jgi:tyrosine-protein kinase Etk/Wzc